MEVISSFIPEGGGRALLVLPEVDEKVVLSARNLPKVCTILARSLNAYEVLKADVVVLPKAGLKVIEKTFLSHG